MAEIVSVIALAHAPGATGWLDQAPKHEQDALIEGYAEQARLLPYGPARQSSIALVGRNPENNAEMRPHLPTNPRNFGRALAVDPDWWATRGAALEARWAEWRKN